mmetsp:Transcript_34532/g.81413  ORF Transcript_34532/g.81413 Transcript_34532/m.81413 type:complete len:80 (+) Transcript_34532:1633-1872(+)
MSHDAVTAKRTPRHSGHKQDTNNTQQKQNRDRMTAQRAFFETSISLSRDSSQELSEQQLRHVAQTQRTSSPKTQEHGIE